MYIAMHHFRYPSDNTTAQLEQSLNTVANAALSAALFPDAGMSPRIFRDDNEQAAGDVFAFNIAISAIIKTPMHFPHRKFALARDSCEWFEGRSCHLW